ncbi:3-dehydroshikimate dehydratase protein [Rutstroemia sp. NJR-2017a BBW]|nr:3-dehydroshikimate dehydratase protein [Rutstroemia sp. NJR-2017a BBW]
MYKSAIASMSLGRCSAGHGLPAKFKAAKDAGLAGIEMFYEDLVDLASTFPDYPSERSYLQAAREIHALSEQYALPIIALGPFSNYEGLLDPSARKEKLEELHLWFSICRILGTDLIQIPSTFAPSTQNTGDMPTIIHDLQQIADIGASYGFRFAFEALCFGTHINTWSASWSVVKGVDRENFGLCLDTFNMAGREYADPASPTGKTPNADILFKQSLARMVEELDPKKIFYIQIVDAERLAAPLDEKHEFHVEGQRPRMSWSRNCRLFLGEQDRGGYLPVMDVVKAICEGLGYTGWVSMELFNKTLLDRSESVPEVHADRAMKSWRYVCSEMGWRQEKGLGQAQKQTQEQAQIAQKKPVEMIDSEKQAESNSFNAVGVEVFARL